ncbi:hypothetical protein [Enterococcus plantarum]|uniref:hypothetical protein n=1 Tax=Enterococcus plantarum TaxID=1077675 RepID=UPI0015E87846|nr:hypothetical protein [Enterococcus plantarum]
MLTSDILALRIQMREMLKSVRLLWRKELYRFKRFTVVNFNYRLAPDFNILLLLKIPIY